MFNLFCPYVSELKTRVNKEKHFIHKKLKLSCSEEQVSGCMPTSPTIVYDQSSNYHQSNLNQFLKKNVICGLDKMYHPLIMINVKKISIFKQKG